MSKIFHINPDTLNVSECKADKGQCRFGKADEHYTSSEAARAAAEDPSRTFVKTEIPFTRPGFVQATLLELESQGDSNKPLLRALREEKRWKSHEKDVLKLLLDFYKVTHGQKQYEPEKLMSRISGLHFAKEALTPKERLILIELEKLQREYRTRRDRRGH